MIISKEAKFSYCVFEVSVQKQAGIKVRACAQLNGSLASKLPDRLKLYR